MNTKTKLLVGIGGSVIVMSGFFFLAVHAASVSPEAESGSLSGGDSSVVSDTTASGNQAVLFKASTGGFQANCINVPSDCGYPDATNTGVPAGVTLTNTTNLTVSTNGAVVENRYITGRLTISANNVTVRNVRIVSGDYYPIYYEGTGLVVEDTEITGTSDAVTACMSFDSYTARRVMCSGGADGFKANADVVIEDSYVFGLRESDGSHNDGVQTTGGSNVTIRHNTFDLRGDVAEVFQLGTEWGSNSNWLIDNNLFAGGGWVFNGGPVNPMTISNNRFAGTRSYGIGYVTGATYTNNYYDATGGAVCISNGC